nr:SLC13 family permease [Candidatus Sigynarchaeota archaeon]
AADGFVNLHSLILIVGMMLVVEVCQQAGMFQFFAITIVKVTGTSAPKLLATLCALAMLMATVLNNVMALIILIPLTVMISRVLDLNPTPYILTQAVIVNMGSTFFSVSSVPNIIIAGSAGISFADFFLNVGVLSAIIGFITIFFFIALYKKQLGYPSKNVDVLREFNVWNFIPNRQLLYKSFIVLFSVMVCFVIIPPEVISLDIIALVGAVVLIVISKVKAADILSKLDIELLLYLLGIFFITGALERLGLLELAGNALFGVSGGDTFVTCLVILWLSAYLSSNLDNISITKVMVPIVSIMSNGLPAGQQLSAFYTLAFGAGWGDNLSPLGDNIVVMNVSAQYKRPVTFKQLFKLGFLTTNFQLALLTIYLSLVFRPLLGLTLLLIAFAVVIIVFILARKIKKPDGQRVEKTEGASKKPPRGFLK